MTDNLIFVDTNVLVYAYDETENVKGPIAERVLAGLWQSGAGVVSTQVLQEFYAVATRKIRRPLTHAKAREIVATYGEWCHLPTDPQLLVSASMWCERHSLSWWDSLIVEAALRSGATTLLSEDLQTDRAIGALTIRNPFTER